MSSLAAMADPEQLYVLHALRLRGPASETEIAQRFSLDPSRLDLILGDLENIGHARLYEGRLAGWMLTTTGRVEGERLLAEQLAHTKTTELVSECYQRFLLLNPDLLSICTDFQVRLVAATEVVNDHLDPVWDSLVLARLADLHQQAVPLADQLAMGLGRFEGYSSRLRHAFERIEQGKTEWLTGPRIDSYHTVWFELHEDFLATLGRRRSDERVEYVSDEDASAQTEEQS